MKRFVLFILLLMTFLPKKVIASATFNLSLQQDVVAQQTKQDQEAKQETEQQAVEENEEILEKKAKESASAIEDKITEKIVQEIAEKLSGETTKSQKVKKDVSVGKIEKTIKVQEKEKEELRNTLVNVFYGKPLPSDLFFVNQKNEIWLGTTLPLSGGVSMVGRDFNYGLNLIFNKINRSGGIGSYMVRLYSLDDKNKVEKIRSNLKELSKKTPFLIGCLGGDAMKIINEEIKNNELLVAFPAEGTEERKSENRYMIHLRPQIETEVSALLTFALKEKFKKKIAIFYESSSFGEKGLAAAEKILDEFGIKVSTRASYPQNTVNINAAVKKIVNNKPDAILCISQARPAYNFIRRIINENLSNCLFLGTSEIYPIQKIVHDSRGIDLVLSSVVPNPFKSELPIVKQYREDMRIYLANRKLSTFSLEGYLAASIFSEAIKSIIDYPTIGNFFSFFENLKAVDFGGINLDFSPETRTLSLPVWINQGAFAPWSIFTLKKQIESKEKIETKKEVTDE